MLRIQPEDSLGKWWTTWLTRAVKKTEFRNFQAFPDSRSTLLPIESLCYDQGCPMLRLGVAFPILVQGLEHGLQVGPKST